MNITHTKVSTIADAGDTGIVRPSDWNANHTLNFRGALAISTASQNIPHVTLTAINWSTETYDTDNIHESTTHPSRLTVPAGVTYARLSANTQWASNSVGFRYITIHKNGTEVVGLPVSKKIASYETEDNIHSAIIPVTGGDYFDFLVYQDSGSSLSFSYGRSWFAMEIIA